VKAIRWKERAMETEEKCSTCDGTGAVAVEVNGVKGIDSCPACKGTGKRVRPANDTGPKRATMPRLAPLVASPSESLSACIAACVASSYGEVRPRQVDPDEVTVVARLGGAR